MTDYLGVDMTSLATILNLWPWYLAGAGLWMFYTGICYAFTFSEDGGRVRFARAFFAFPVWPVGVVALTALLFRHLWKAAAWGKN